MTLADGSIPIKGTYTLDPAQEPKAMDLTDTFGADAGKTFLAIYSLEGDRFIFCATDEGQQRPTEFRTRPGQVLRVIGSLPLWPIERMRLKISRGRANDHTTIVGSGPDGYHENPQQDHAPP